MSEWTLHTGFMGSKDTINIDWYNENNVRQAARLDIVIQEQDKPRTLEIRLNDVIVAIVNNKE